MRWKSHVRFGGRAGETHRAKARQGTPVRPLHRASDPRGQGVLRSRPRRLVPTRGRMVDDSTPSTALVTSALGMSIEQRRPTSETIIHSGQGTQFTSWAFTRRAVDSGLLPSMGSVGDCFDAVVESFWSRMQVELLDRKRWMTRVELASAIFEYLEIFHNRQRRHSSLGMLTPVEFEARHQPSTAA